MNNLRNRIHQRLLLFCIFFLIFFSSSYKVFAEEIEWLEVSKTNNELLSINILSQSSIIPNNIFCNIFIELSNFLPSTELILTV